MGDVGTRLAAQTYLHYLYTVTQNGGISKIDGHRRQTDCKGGLMPIRRASYDSVGNHTTSGQAGENPWRHEQKESAPPLATREPDDLNKGLLPLPLPLTSESSDPT